MNNERSLLSRLYPTTKFMITIALCMAAFIVPGYGFSYAILPICMVLAYFAGDFKEFSNLAIKALLMIVVFIFILQSFFYPGNDILWSWSIFSIKREGLEFALFLTSKSWRWPRPSFCSSASPRSRIWSIPGTDRPAVQSNLCHLVDLTAHSGDEKADPRHYGCPKTRGVETEGRRLSA